MMTYRYIFAILLFVFAMAGKAEAQLYIAPNSTVSLEANTTFSVNGDVEISNTATLETEAEVYVSGDWTNNGTINANGGFVSFYGLTNSVIGGTNPSIFYALNINKTDAFNNLVLMQNDISVLNGMTIDFGIFRFVFNLSAWTLNIGTDLDIAATGTIEVDNSAVQTHQLNIDGNITNSGTLDFQNGPGLVNTTFQGSTNSVVSGSSVSEFNEIEVDKDDLADEVQMNVDFNSPDQYLTLTRGTFHIGGNYNYARTTFSTALSTYSIPAGAGFWLDNVNATVVGLASLGCDLDGLLRLSHGQFNIGNGGTASNLYYSDGSQIIIENPYDANYDNTQLNVTGVIAREVADNAAAVTYTQNHGTVSVGEVQTSIANRGVFDIGAATSSFTWTDGRIRLQRNNSAMTNGDYLIAATTNSVTGGRLWIYPNTNIQGQTEFTINSIAPVYEFRMDTSAAGIGDPFAELVTNDLTVLDDVYLVRRGLSLNALTMNIGGDIINSCTNATGFDNGNGTVVLNGGSDQNILGSQQSTFYNLRVNQSVGGNTVFLNNTVSDMNTYVRNNLRMLSNTIIDLNQHKLTIGPTGKIYSGLTAVDTALNTFSTSKMILNSNSGGNYEGRLVREIEASGLRAALELTFPVGTPGVYTWGKISFNENKATFVNGDFVEVKPIPLEHPAVEVNNRSLVKYFAVESQIDSLYENGGEIRFKYDATEPRGTEGVYVVLFYTPAWDSTNAYWIVEPGLANDVVDFNNKLFYSQQVSTIDGNWTAGEIDVAQVTYYTRQKGDYNDPNTWSKIGFGDVASTTIPNKRSDRVRIRDTVTVPDGYQPAPARNVSIEKGLVGAQTKIGMLTIEGDEYIDGDSCVVEAECVLEIGGTYGITQTGAGPTSGNVQTDYRSFSNQAIYVYNGSQAEQFSGNGIPTPTKTIIIDKAPGDTLKLNKSIAINDSLVIRGGIFDDNFESIDGNSSGRTLYMFGGEFIIRQSFPDNYTAPYFTTGTINFSGTGSITIPGTGAGVDPAVIQYHNLKISGDRAASSSIVFRQQDSIYIKNIFSLDEINFQGSPSTRFLTDGSTVVFNMNGGTQDIPNQSNSPLDPVMNLSYYNLVLDSAGTKQLNEPTGNPTFVVQNDLNIRNSANFALNDRNIEINGDWVNTQGTFDPGTGTNWVKFKSIVPTVSTNVTSRDTSDNYFWNVVIDGTGNVEPLDNMKIRNDITFESGSNLLMTTTNLTLQGDWINNGGQIVPGSGTVTMDGTVRQSMSKTSGNEIFWDLEIANNAGVDAYLMGANSEQGIIISNSLDLGEGILFARNHSSPWELRQVTMNGTISRVGSQPGHIDGRLSKYMDSATTSESFEVGFNTQYTPVTIEFTGVSGNPGYVYVNSDTISTANPATTPISPGILPAGSTMDDDKSVRRQWTYGLPALSTFEVGEERTYDITMNYVGGDIRNGADPLKFEPRLYESSAWTPVYRFGQPQAGVRTTTSTKDSMLVELGTFMVGEPTVITYYSIANGDWTNNNNWSTQGYGGVPSSTYPSETDDNNNYKVYIGEGITIDLDANMTVNDDGAFEGFVQIDSSGILNCDTYVISGSGDFYIMADGVLGTANANGIAASAASGSIQTGNRFFNYLDHNASNFIYNGGNTQTSGDGVPDSIATLTVNKTANAVTLSQQVVILDSLHLVDGDLTAGAQIVLAGDFRRESGAGFNHGNQTILIAGPENQYFTDTDASALSVQNLTMNKQQDAGDFIQNDDSPITVNGTLLFASTNRGIIDGWLNSGNYIEALGTVNRSGLGHVNGELRKVIPAGNPPNITFEVGDTTYYTPFEINFGSGSGSVSGVIGVQNLPGKLAALDLFTTPIDPARYIPRYWRVTQPSGSTFDRGTRSMTVELNFIDPDDIGTVDHPTCIEIAYYKGVFEDWQELRPNTTAGNFGFGCSDTRFDLGSIDYDGSMTTVEANDIPGSTTFGTQEFLANGSLLLGDFVTGNQNSGVTMEFYTRQDGDWTDPNTWSTTGYGGAPAGRYPDTQYDVAYIGNGNRVVFDESIGTSFLYSTIENAYYGPAVVVQETGTINLESNVLRGVGFTAEKGATVEVGSYDGLRNNGRGNILSLTRTFEDSINVVYTGHGETPRFSSGVQYCRVNWNAGSNYITRTRVQDDDPTPNTIMDNQTNATFKARGYFHFADESATMEEGEQYRLIINRSFSNNAQVAVWIDWDRDGTLENNNERVVYADYSGSTVTTNYFTVPAGTEPGTTRMRVACRNSTSGFSSCNSNLTGEVEDYEIKIVNDSYIITQISGDAVPDNLASLQVNSERTNPSTVQLQKDLTVRDSVKIVRGYFDQGSNDIYLQGDFINDFATDGYDHGNSEIIMYGGADQTIRGDFSSTFYDISLEKDSNLVIIDTDSYVENQVTFENENLLFINDNRTLILEESASLSPGSGSFDKDRMIQLSGTATAGALRKEFTNVAGQKTFYYPVGIDTIFNPADLTFTASYGSNPYLQVQVMDGLHPNRLSDNLLMKYWRLTSNDISNLGNNNLDFYYSTRDTFGLASEYIPAVYLTSIGEWEINVGDSPSATASPIEVTNVPDVVGLDGDWTAGEADGFFIGRVFWSIGTGDWNNPDNWSNIGHTSTIPASYYPGQIYDKDTVFIDGHTMDFNVEYALIDSLKIGGSYGGIGTLNFAETPQNKLLQTGSARSSIMIDNDGVITGTNPGNRFDTLQVCSNIVNNSLAANGGSVSLYQDATNYTVLKLCGDTTAVLDGDANGVWNTLGPIVMNKQNGLLDTLIIRQATFAQATGLVSEYEFIPLSGVVRMEAGTSDFKLALDKDVTMQQNTGFEVRSGSISALNSLITDVNTTIYLNGGDFNVGNAQEEHYQYNTGNIVTIEDGIFSVASSFKRRNLASLANLTINSNGELKVLTEGSSNASTVGLDITNSASTFNMDGGRIIVSRHATGATADYRNNATAGTGMTAGTIQIGDSLLTQNGDDFKIAGTMPIWNMRLVGPSSGTAMSSFTEPTFTIKNDFYNDDNQTAEFSGNTVRLAGDLYNYGAFDGTSGRLTLNGSGANQDQTIFNEDGDGVEFYQLRLNKNNTGVITLAAAGNSSVIIRNQLEFSTNNQSIIDARTNDRSVTMNSGGASNPQVLRNGVGHVNGRFNWNVLPGDNVYTYPIGNDDVSEYRPAEFETVGSGGTAGLVGAMVTETPHPEVATLVAPVDTANYILPWWNINTDDTFDLNAGSRSFTLTTTFLNPTDMYGPPSISFLQHHRRTPGWDTLGFSWETLSTPGNTSTTVVSDDNELFGDFILGEPDGEVFYTRADGDWNDPNTWSLAGYGGAPAGRFPNLETDIVRIGDNNSVTVPDGLTPLIRSIRVENYNPAPGDYRPGSLFIAGDLGYVSGTSFVLDDSTTLGVMHLNGIASTGGSGAIRMTNRDFGVSRYVYNSTYGSQNTGTGLPDSVMALIIDNQSATTNNVWINFDPNFPTLKVADSIQIFNGTLNTGNRDLDLYGDFSIYNQGLFEPNDKTVSFLGSGLFGSGTNTINIGNVYGLEFYDLDVNLNGSNILVDMHGTADPDSAHIYVQNELDFISASRINVRDGDRKVVIRDGATLTQTALGYIDGILQKPVGAGAETVFFEIGDGADYTPATVTLDNTGGNGTAGSVQAASYSSVPIEPYYGNRLDQNSRLERFWRIMSSDTTNGFAMGDRKANVRLQFPASELTFNTADASLRRKSVPAEVPFWDERWKTELNWDALTAYVDLDGLTDLWDGLGEFYIGVKADRTFYSLRDGDWNDGTMWSFESHVGTPVIPGVYPNDTERELVDNVYIGIDHQVALNVPTTTIDTLYIYNSSRFDIGDNEVVSSNMAEGTLELRDGAFLAMGGNRLPDGVSFIDFANFVVDPGSTFEFHGTQFLIDNPFGLPNYPNNVLVSGSGYVTVNLPILIQGTLTIIDVSTLENLVGVSSLEVWGNVTNNSVLINRGEIDVGN
jgi:hypothetical protein